MKIYIDVCALNRPLDDQTQPRVRLEAESILLILDRIDASELTWLSSSVVQDEVDQTRDPHRRERVLELLKAAASTQKLDDTVQLRQRELSALGFKPFDALHLAAAEVSGCDVFLTTDDRLCRLAARVASELCIQVANPVDWIREIDSL